MSDLKDIRQRLKDENKIEELLLAIGCENIDTEQRGFLYTAQLPEKFNSRNSRAVQVKMNDSLSCYIRNRGDFDGGSIYDLISYIYFDKRGDDEYTKNLHASKEFVCKTFGWNEYLNGTNRNIIVKDYTSCLKELLGEQSNKKPLPPNPVLPEETLLDYFYRGAPLSCEKWIEEGISHKTQVFYGIGFDLWTKRITIPMRNRFGQLVGVKGRIYNSKDDDRKYLYVEPYNNRLELFNFHIALPYILQFKRVYVFEGEKSCMKAFDNGIYNTVSIGQTDITPEQAQMIKQIGLDIEIVLCYDNDKTIEEIKSQAEIFEGRDRVFGMYDVDGLLGEKDEKNSPIDKGFDVWEELVNHHCYPIAI